MYNLSGLELWFFSSTILHTVSLLSSSFVEEEHQTWYFYTITTFVVLTLKSTKIYLNDYQKGTKEDSRNVNSFDDMNTNSEVDDITASCYQRNMTARNITSNKIKMMSDSSDKPSLSIKNIKNDAAVGVGMCVMATILCRTLRTWNQTGDKWSHLPDVGDWLVR